MSLTINLYYTGKNGSARKFVKEMEESGLADKIRHEPGNERYEYFYPADDLDTVLLIDSWINQEAIDKHHKSPMMAELAKLREKYDLHMKVERFIPAPKIKSDEKFIRK
ncbi:antibiotic biosynthesis monooxygenase [Lactobacillus sp. PV037]|uniref:putative quinol monooxygenase n=1 Tax=unclassified Lactobacillus TaxID=2620435 RepID=UPI00223F874C|nr:MULTISPECIES: antibiotic biosynthesis monooxygenase [unclassified Lactobacillus]QNQ81624.1 antibiotic biosynthesis monooxygenase [Lactobacillus sp. PV012]QNQ84331.1 antibiotic biosynthesis monooxygenase [Lactobacillus sp. PV037]